MKKIKLTQNKYSIVDDEYYDNLNKYKWHFGGRYARRQSSGSHKTRSLLFLHIEILKILGIYISTKEVDHINGDTLDNRLINLRLCSRKENSRNKKKEINGTSRYKGVYWASNRNKWRTRIVVSGKTISLGCFDDEKIAGRAYDKAAIKYFGEFARTNFPKVHYI